MWWTAFTSWAGGVWGWFIKTPVAQVIVAALLWLLAWEQVKRELEKSGEKKERQRNEVKQAQVRLRVNERSTEIINEEREHADQALEARDNGPLYPSAAVMPDELKRVAIRDQGGS